MFQKVSELKGAALDWAVAKALGEYRPISVPNYSTDWALGGEILDREQIIYDFRQSYPANSSDKVQARLSRAKLKPDRSGGWDAPKNGPTILIAAMRCFCCSKFGDEVEVPEELI